MAPVVDIAPLLTRLSDDLRLDVTAALDIWLEATRVLCYFALGAQPCEVDSE